MTTPRVVNLSFASSSVSRKTLTRKVADDKVTREVRQIPCHGCMGAGHIPKPRVALCEKCAGYGITLTKRDGIERLCSSCNGEGEVETVVYKPCSKCQGKGHESKIYEIETNQCKKCFGFGYVLRECKKCRGEGVITLPCKACEGQAVIIERDRRGNEYGTACLQCGGTGRGVKQHKCTGCDGKLLVGTNQECPKCDGKGARVTEREIVPKAKRKETAEQTRRKPRDPVKQVSEKKPVPTVTRTKTPK